MIYKLNDYKLSNVNGGINFVGCCVKEGENGYYFSCEIEGYKETFEIHGFDNKKLAYLFFAALRCYDKSPEVQFKIIMSIINWKLYNMKFNSVCNAIAYFDYVLETVQDNLVRT